MRELRRPLPIGRFVTINLPSVRNRSEWNGAADLVIDYGYCLQAVAKSLMIALAEFRSSDEVDRTDALIENAATFEARLGYAEFTEQALRYAAMHTDSAVDLEQALHG